jgi:hypothetical protein
MKRLALALLPVVLLSGAACKKSEPPPPPPTTAAPATTTLPPAPSVVGVSVGNAIGADKKVTAASETLGPKDTIYASVDTAGSGHIKLKTVFSFVKGDKTKEVDAPQTIEFDSIGPATNEFHVSKPSGWPKGDYKVDVFLNDSAAPAATRAFKVG